MHTEMWQNAATAGERRAPCASRGVHVVGPAVGQLTGTDSGAGPDGRARGHRRRGARRGVAASALDRRSGGRDLAGRRVLITAGGTREPLDPVRFLGNRSSGKQGVALAEAARDRGADVMLIAAHLEVAVPDGRRGRRRSRTALELLGGRASPRGRDADVVIMAAAVADYRPETVADRKIKKETSGRHARPSSWCRTPTSCASSPRTAATGQVVVGFAAETEPDPAALLALGRAEDRGARASTSSSLNRVGWTAASASEDNAVIVLERSGDVRGRGQGDKQSVADRILDLVASA